MSIDTLRPEQCPPTFPLELIAEDGVPLESEWHRDAMNLLCDVTKTWMAMCGETDYCVGGNMFIYFNAAKKRDQDFRGPDYFFVRGVEFDKSRDYWAVWEEGGKFPDVLMEFGSSTTLHVDETIKKEIYEKSFRTPEYFIFDPATNLLRGWRLVNDVYEPIVPNENGWLWSEQLGLWIGNWHGKYMGHEYVFPRLFDEDGTVVPTDAEREHLELERERKKVEAERKKAREAKKAADAALQYAEAEARRAAEERKRADAESRKAEDERKRADAAEAEIARLKALLKNGKS